MTRLPDAPVHYLPHHEWEGRGYFEHVVCGAKAWRYLISASGKYTTCRPCLFELEVRQAERNAR